MKKIFSLILTLSIIVWFTPIVTHAADVELISGGDTLTSIDDMQAPEEVTMLGYYTTDPVGTEYDLVFQTNGLEPAVMVVMGEMNEQWSYDPETSLLTMHVALTNIGDAAPADFPDGINMMAIGMVPAVPDEQQGQVDGPPGEAAGMYISTNVFDWQMVSPSQDNPQFGFVLTGPEGHDGFLNFFVPNNLVEYLGTTKEDLVLFVDDAQQTINFTDLGDGENGGALFEINLTFTGESFESSSLNATASTDITKKVATGEALPLSLTADTGVAAKGEKVQLFGWLKSGAEGKRVVFMRKIGKGKFQRFKQVKTKEDGYFSTTVKMQKKKLTFKAKLKGTQTISPKKVITRE